MCRNPLPVASAGHVPHPRLVLEIPANGHADATFKRGLRLPSQLTLDLARVHRVAAVVAGPILHKCDQVATWPVCPWRHLIHQITDCPHDLKVWLLIPATDVIGLAGSSTSQHS